MSMTEFNHQIIDEFRANEGKVGGGFAGAPVVLLTTKGAKSGRLHTTPLVCLLDGDGVYVIASFGGAPQNPAWFHNLVANPRVTVELGADTYEADAVVVADRAERDRLYAAQVAIMPGFGDYEKKSTRLIPVVELRRVG